VELIRDWQLLLTHVVGFLLVLWLLRRFAWGPVLAFLEQRRQRIQAEFDSIERQHQEAARLKAEYEDHLRNIEAEGRQKIQEAVKEGNTAAAKIKERAQEERRQRLERASEEVHMLEDSAKETLRKRTVELALRAAEKAVQERLDDPKHEQLIGRFIEDLEAKGMESR
jgi:F-type H+-transporting ATPase subunit b